MCRRRAATRPQFVRRPYLCPTVCSLVNAESDEPGIRHSDQNVVDAVHVNAPDASLLHILHEVLGRKSPVKTTVSIWEVKRLLAAYQTHEEGTLKAVQCGPRKLSVRKERLRCHA